MANISFAKGLLTFEGSKIVQEALVDVLVATERDVEYNVYFDEQKAREDLKKMDKLEISFSGSGRWSYHNNIEHLYQWITEDIRKGRIKGDKERIEDAWHFLETQDWMLIFDFDDCEPGLDVLYSEEVAIRHKKGERKGEIIVYNEVGYD